MHQPFNNTATRIPNKAASEENLLRHLTVSNLITCLRITYSSVHLLKEMTGFLHYLDFFLLFLVYVTELSM